MSGGIGSEIADHMEAIPLADMTLEDQAVFRRAVEWLRHADELEAIAVNAMNLAAGGTYAGPDGVSFADRIHELEGALKGVFARLDHPDNGGQFVSYFVRWPEVEAARKTLTNSERI